MTVVPQSQHLSSLMQFLQECGELIENGGKGSFYLRTHGKYARRSAYGWTSSIDVASGQ